MNLKFTSALPNKIKIPPSELPLWAQPLLTQRTSITKTLEQAWGEVMILEVLAKSYSTSTLTRTAILSGGATGCGALWLHVHFDFTIFPPEVQERIHFGREPLGSILADHAIPFRNEPVSFFKVNVSPSWMTGLDQSQGLWLYGRDTIFLDAKVQEFGRSEEVLLEKPFKSQNKIAEWE